MKDYTSKDIRNVVLLGATKSGKTTLSEAMLFEGKVIDRRGSVEDKNTVSDYNELEKINQRSIYSTPLYAEFLGAKVNVTRIGKRTDRIGSGGRRSNERTALNVGSTEIKIGTRYSCGECPAGRRGRH